MRTNCSAPRCDAPLLNRRELIRAAAVLLACSISATASAAPRMQPVSVAIVGDSLANDLGRGMEALYRGRRNVRVIKWTRFATGLVRDDYFDWDTTLRGLLRKSNPDLIVVVLGGNDHQTIRTKAGRLDPFSRAWLAEYERRVRSFMAPLKREGAKVYWVSLPAVRSPSMTRSFATMNRIYKRQAQKHGFKFVSIWDTFFANGAYSSFGMSLNGIKRQLRENDGMHFTEDGRLRLAAKVSTAIGLR